MTKQEFMRIASAINTYYPKEKPFPNEAAIQLWYEEFKELPYQDVANALRRHVNVSKWCPTIAELKDALVVNVAGQKDWGKHWEVALRATQRFGRNQEEEALAWMDPLTREVVKRLGYKELCNSYNQMADRANFRTVFEQIINKEREMAALPKGLRDQIAQIGDLQRLEAGDEFYRADSEATDR